MATYIFENTSQSQAAAFGAGDTLVFSSTNASATTVSVSPYTTPGASGSLAGTGINLSFNGETLTFPDTLSTASQAGHILFNDGSDLIIGSNGTAAETLGSTTATVQQVIYGLAGNDTINLAVNSSAGTPTSSTTFVASDVVYGGVGNDTIGTGSSNGNYHIYGNAAGSPTPLASGQTDVDTIVTGAGSSYIQGNAGADVITVGVNAGLGAAASTGNNTIFGGADNDTITLNGAGYNHINGNMGFDTINASAATGNNTIRGGAGNDIVRAGSGHDTISGDLGSDDLFAGQAAGHITVLTGGDGADNFHFTAYSATVAGSTTTVGSGAAVAQGTGTAAVAGSTALYFNEVTDFTAGTDHIDLGYVVNSGSSAPTGSTFSTAGILLQDSGVSFSTESAAATYAQQLLTTAAHTGDVAAIQVGSDTYLFYNSAQGGTYTIDSVIKLDGVTATNLTQSATATGAHDFTAASITHS